MFPTEQTLLPQPASPYTPQEQNSMPGGRGYNTFHGFDTGPLPPGFTPGQLTADHPVPPGFGWQQQLYGWPAMAAPPALPGYPYPYPYPHPGQAHPAMPPMTEGGFPGIQ